MAVLDVIGGGKPDVSVLAAGNQSLTGVFLGAEIINQRTRDMIGRVRRAVPVASTPTRYSVMSRRSSAA